VLTTIRKIITIITTKQIQKVKKNTIAIIEFNL